MSSGAYPLEFCHDALAYKLCKIILKLLNMSFKLRLHTKIDIQESCIINDLLHVEVHFCVVLIRGKYWSRSQQKSFNRTRRLDP